MAIDGAADDETRGLSDPRPTRPIIGGTIESAADGALL